MENKKIIIAIIIVVALIVGLVTASCVYSDFNKKQLNILTEETNNLLQSDIINEEINTEIKTERNYAVVERAIKEYITKIKNIYVEIDEVNSNINPNDIFSAANIGDRDYDDINNIISEYKNIADKSMTEYDELLKEENILKNIEEKDISPRKEYYEDLYKTAMLSDVMKEKYNSLKEKIQQKEYELNNKLDILEDIEEYLEKNEKYWSIKDDKIQFNNLNIMTEYYNLLNKLTD